MAKQFRYVHERIRIGQKKIEARMRQIPVCGSKTPPASMRRIREVISAEAVRVARECAVLINYPRTRIEGNRVVLGEVSILLPNMKFVTLEQLEKIELRKQAK